jgi:hypothetical protein
MHQDINEQPAHAHEWIVLSGALDEGWLMLQCVGCAQHGVVLDASFAEWTETFDPPSRPFRWYDDSRVKIQSAPSDGLLYVMRASRGKKCECYTRLGVLEPEDYERVPAEILRPAEALTAEAREDLEEYAEFVAPTDLCSLFFPHFLRGFREHTDHEVPEAVWRFAMKIELANQRTLHCSASVVAHVLREYARRGATQMK